MPGQFNPFRPIEERPRERTLMDALVDAHGRYLQRAGKTAEDFGFNQYVDMVARDLEETAPEKAKAIRDWRAQRQAGPQAQEAFLQQRLADANAFGGGESLLTGALRDVGIFGDRSLEQTIEDESETSIGQDLARMGLLAFNRYADTRTLGAGRFLRGLGVDARRHLGLMPEEFREGHGLGAMGGAEMWDTYEQMTRGDLANQGVAPWVTGGLESAGGILGLMGAMGYVNRFGEVLKATQATKTGLPFVGRALQNPAIGLLAAEGAISEGEIRFAQLAGEDERAAALRAGQPGRMANAAMLAALLPAAQFVGGAAERVGLRLLTRGTERATFMREAISEAPNLWLRARLGAAHVGGKAVEFGGAFSLMPQAYRPGPDGRTELSPWIRTILNPAKIAEALGGNRNAQSEYADAVAEVFTHAFEHSREQFLAGAVTGMFGLGKARVGGPASLGEAYRPSLRLGPRELTGAPRPMGAAGEEMTPQERARRLYTSRLEREARKPLSPEERRLLRESIQKGLFQGAEGADNASPEMLQSVVNYVVAAAEAQRGILARMGSIDPKTPTLADLLRRYYESDLGPDLFAGPLKSGKPGLGVKVRLDVDPERPGAQDNRVAEVLEVLPVTPPGRAEPRRLMLAHVRFEDGREGLVDLDATTLVEAPGGGMLPAPKGAAEGAAPEGPVTPRRLAEYLIGPGAPESGVPSEWLPFMERVDQLVPSLAGKPPIPKPRSLEPRRPDDKDEGQTRLFGETLDIPEAPRRRATDRPGAPEGAPRGRRYADFEIREGDSEQVKALKRRVRRLMGASRAYRGQAETDALTGAGSQALWERVRSRVDADKRLEVAIVDLSGLGMTNDYRGQAAGDQAMRAMGERVRGLAEEAGIAGRLVFRSGGDEMTVAGDPKAMKAFKRLGADDARALLERVDLPGGKAYENRLIIGTGKTYEEASSGLAQAKARWKAEAERRGLVTDKDVVKGLAISAEPPVVSVERIPAGADVVQHALEHARSRGEVLDVAGRLRRLKKDALAAAAKGLGLEVDGTKADLVTRLMERITEEARGSRRVEAEVEAEEGRQDLGATKTAFSNLAALVRAQLRTARAPDPAFTAARRILERRTQDDMVEVRSDEEAAQLLQVLEAVVPKTRGDAAHYRRLAEELRKRLSGGSPETGDLEGGEGAEVLVQGLEEAPEPPSAFDRARGTDEYLYHVTSAPAAVRILKEGLRAGGGPTGMFQAGSYPAYGKNRVFLTERDGVGFWVERVEQALRDRYDDPPPVRVLRVKRGEVKGLVVDETGSQDARAKSYYVEGKQPPAGGGADKAPDPVPDGKVVVEGDPVQVRQEGAKERVSGRYAVVRLEDVLESHDAGAGFSRRPGYPSGLQPRDYAASAAEQAKVREMASGFDPAEIANTSPRPDQGPPSVAWDAASERFVVLNGNGRLMALREALKRPGVFEAYRRQVESQAGAFGLARALGEGEVLVRVVDLHPESKAGQKFARYGNRPAGLPQRSVDRAAAEADLLTDSVLRNLSEDAEATLAEAVNGPRGAAFRKDLAQRLGRAGNDLFHEDLTLTEAGKEFVQNMLLVKSGLPAETINRLSRQLRRTVSASAVQLASLRKNPKTASISNRFARMLDWVNRYLEGGNRGIAEYLERKPDELLETREPMPESLEDQAMVFGISANANAPRRMRDRLASLIQDYEDPAQGKMFDVGERTELERLGDAFGLEVGADAVRYAAMAEEAREAGMPDPREASELHRLPENVREALGLSDPIRGAPIGGVDMPVSLEQRPGWEGKRTAQSAIIAELQSLFDVPIRIQRSNKFRGGKVLGFYKVGRHVIRLADAADFVTASHEAGHSMERYVFPAMAEHEAWSRMRQELRDAGMALYGPKEPWNGYVSEGWAEFMRLYLTQPDLAARHLPSTLKWFERAFKPANEKSFRAGLEKIRKMAADYADQGWHNRILSTIVKGKVGPTPLQKMMRFWGKDKWWEELSPIERLVERARESGIDLSPHEDPYQLAYYFRGSASAVAQHMATRGMVDPAGRRVGPALADAVAIVEQAAKRRGMSRDEATDHFRTYLVAARTLELATRGIRSSNIRVEDATQAVSALTGQFPEFLKASRMVWAWNHGILTYMRQLGAITAEDYQRVLERNRLYVPFQRVIPDEVRSSLGIRGSNVARSGLRAIQGSGRDIRDPFPQMVAHAAQMLRFAHRRAVMARVADLGRHPEMGRWIEKVDRDMVKKAAPLETFRRELEKAGLEVTEDADLTRLITWYEPKTLPDSKDPIIPHVTRSGKVEWYQVSRDLWEALSGADVYRLPGALDLFFGVPARLKRLGTTGLRASFSLVTNPLRDFFTMMLQSQSKNPLEIAGEWARGQADSVKALFGRDSHYGDFWSAVGGVMAQPLGQDLARTFRLGENLGRNLFRRVGADVKRGHLIQATGDVLDALRDLLQTPEAGPRIAELRMVAKRIGHDPKRWETIRFEDALDQAIQLKRGGAQVTVDFSAAGKFARIVNAAVPFFNVAIQGPRTFLRAWQRDPIATTLLGMGLTAATLQLWWKNKDEEWYKDLPWREKFQYWHIADGDVRLRIPRPFEIGLVFATMPEATLDSMYREDPETVKAGLSHAFDVVLPDALPVLVQEYVEQARNFDEFRDRPIVPKAEETMPAEEQYGPVTTVLARRLGRLMGWSPRRIDHAIEGVFGGVGRDVARGFGTVSPAGRDAQPSDIPVLGRLFSIDGVQGASSQAVQDFFDMRGNLQVRQNSRENPITPQERAALRVLERAARRLRTIREARAEEPSLEARSRLIQEMRRLATEAMRRAEELLAPGANAVGEGPKGGGPEAARRLFTIR